MISIQHIKKAYPNATPLKDVNAEIHKGEIISIIGPSGTGKSTLLRCINHLEAPTDGKIIVDGVDITEKGCKLNLVRQKMGMVFQSFNLFSHMNVIENIMYAPMKLKGLSKEEAHEKAMSLLRTVSLADKALNYPDELSGGQKQRVAIARTLAMDPDVILFDEPTSALDPSMVREVVSVMKGLAAEGMTMMIVTHDMELAKDISTRIFYMDQGLIYEDGTPDQIFNNPHKELTRQFVRRLRVLKRTLIKDSFDYLGFMGELEEYGKKNDFSKKSINRMITIVEELCFQTIVQRQEEGEELDFTVEFSEKENSCELLLKWQGPSWDPFEDMDPISKALVVGMSRSAEHEYQDGTNNVKVVVNIE